MGVPSGSVEIANTWYLSLFSLGGRGAFPPQRATSKILKWCSDAMVGLNELVLQKTFGYWHIVLASINTEHQNDNWAKVCFP